ncbi:uncharacterized protein TNCV_2713011 [Trichonephila clavipes]|nr:uncharacterized protein TNCV_2713011 [Trichonephila clavipes]
MIVLAWLRKEPMDLKTFVQNRVAKIQELYPNQLWRHVPSDQNPADLVSRGVDPDKLLQQNLWFNGPTFLSDNLFFIPDLAPSDNDVYRSLPNFLYGKNFGNSDDLESHLLECFADKDQKLYNHEVSRKMATVCGSFGIAPLSDEEVGGPRRNEDMGLLK